MTERNLSEMLAHALSRRRMLGLSLVAVGWPFGRAVTPTQQAPTQQTPDLGSRQPVSFVTSWYAQAEHGGFYQAQATGIYAEQGLDVTIQMGGTGVNILQLLAGHGVDFAMGSSLDALNALAAGIPLVTVAAFFQKDPQCLLVHPDAGIQTLADLQGHPIYVSPGANLSFWPFLQSRYGFSDDQKRPYAGSLAPFLLDHSAAQQGYITAETFRFHQQTGFDPGVIWLADYGYNPYVTTIETHRDLIQQDPDKVRRFVQASIQGWQSYLQDPAPAHRLIKQANPQMNDELLAYGYAQLVQRQITGMEPAQIGQMTHQRWQDLYETMVEVGMFPPGLPYRDAYTLDFLPST